MGNKSSNTLILKLNIVYVYLIVLEIHDSVASIEGVAKNKDTAASLKRNSFPANFIFGTSSSSYQYEGAVDEGGKGPSIWDTFTQKYPNKIKDRSNGTIAVDSYHRYKEDVNIMKDIGFDAYRFSISWSRLLPGGNLTSGINREGIMYYNNLINELLLNGIQPFVTLFHYDYPQSLEDAYLSFLSPQIVKDFADFAELCFKEFGDRVKHWITFNGPSIFSELGFATGQYAPGRCSNWVQLNCTGGDSSVEPYLVTHHQLLAHAAAVKIYREKYQNSQMGQIGIILAIDWVIPLSQSIADHDAASRVRAFKIDWLMEPLNSGSYPAEMVNYVGERLPKFSEKQSNMVQKSFDFVGINYYSTAYAANVECPSENKNYLTDFCANITYERNGIPIGPKAASDWIYIYPKGIEEVLVYMKNKFSNPVLYITENGFDDINNGERALNDGDRIGCHLQHLSHVRSALLDGVNVRGYFAWSLLDNFEWADGYSFRFGIVYVDYRDGLKRYPKESAKWFKRFLYQGSDSQ